MNQRGVLEDERAALLDAIAEIEADIRDDERIAAEQGGMATYDSPMWDEKRRRDSRAFADAATNRVEREKVRLALRRKWLRDIELWLAAMPSDRLVAPAIN